MGRLRKLMCWTTRLTWAVGGRVGRVELCIRRGPGNPRSDKMHNKKGGEIPRGLSDGTRSCWGAVLVSWVPSSLQEGEKMLGRGPRSSSGKK
jgi:hypothetical protein